MPGNISRRDFLNYVGASIGGAYSFRASAVNPGDFKGRELSNRARKSPNILLIYSDQHRYDCLGVAGHPDVDTPHIDAVAADGVWVFKQLLLFECLHTIPLLAADLVCMYTSMVAGEIVSTLPVGIPTFPRILRDQGYDTAAVGKMHFYTHLFGCRVLKDEIGRTGWKRTLRRRLSCLVDG